jgi:hypothetical protein
MKFSPQNIEILNENADEKNHKYFPSHDMAFDQKIYNFSTRL